MTISTTQIITRGYDITLPTAAVQAFLSLPHDEQVELADVVNALFGDEDEISEPETSVTDMLIEELASELDVTDQVIDAHMDERNELVADNDALTDILLQTALYVGRTRDLLTGMGITLSTDEDGQPVLQVNPFGLAEFVDANFG